MEHVVHVVEHVEVRVLPEMICGPFSRVPGWDKMIFRNSKWLDLTLYGRSRRDWSGRSVEHWPPQIMHVVMPEFSCLVLHGQK